MDRKQEVMVALGAAIGANCIPCFDHLYARAKEMNLDDNDIRIAIETGFKVKNGAMVFIKNAVSDVVGELQNDQQTCCEAFPGACGDDGCS